MKPYPCERKKCRVYGFLAIRLRYGGKKAGKMHHVASSRWINAIRRISCENWRHNEARWNKDVTCFFLSTMNFFSLTSSLFTQHDYGSMSTFFFAAAKGNAQFKTMLGTKVELNIYVRNTRPYNLFLFQLRYFILFILKLIDSSKRWTYLTTYFFLHFFYLFSSFFVCFCLQVRECRRLALLFLMTIDTIWRYRRLGVKKIPHEGIMSLVTLIKTLLKLQERVRQSVTDVTWHVL